MGINVSEHPAFGRVGQHSRGSAHYSGRAIDVNGPPGIVEANDPVWGPKFDKLAQSMRASGYKVIWRSEGHYNHLHAQIGGAGEDTMVAGGPTGMPGGIGSAGFGAASQGYAVNRACACPPMDLAVINRTVTNDIRTNIFQQMAGPTYRPQSMISPFMIGAQIGSILRKLF
jgi:hypothetical protein